MRQRLLATTALSGPLAELVLDVAMAVMVERVKAGRGSIAREPAIAMGNVAEALHQWAKSDP